jgi:hypothetical protein
MNGSVPTESRDPAAKAVNADDGENGKQVKAGAGRRRTDVQPAKSAGGKKGAARKTDLLGEPAGSGGKSAVSKQPAADNPAAASQQDSGSSFQATGQSTGDAGTVTDELPRRRRGILLGTRPGPMEPAATDDEKSLSWMATQAVKALNAVKASQQEQLEALKARAETSRDEQALAREDEDISLDASEPAQPSPEEQMAALRARNSEEVTADAASLAVQSGMAAMAPLPASTPPLQSAAVGQPNSVPVVQPVESSPKAATTPQVPAGVRRAAPARIPARMALMIGVLVMFSYAGYRHWFAGEHAAEEMPSATSAFSEPAGPAAEVNMMTPPAISVVAAPEPPAGRTEPAAVEAETAPTRGPVEDVPPAPAATRERSEPAAGPQEEAVSGMVLQPAAPNPAPTTLPAEWHPAAPPAAEAAVPAGQAVPPAPSPAAEAAMPAGQPVPKAPEPAPKPRYPASGYGHYPPPSAWQRYYRPGYPQSPARQ